MDLNIPVGNRSGWLYDSFPPDSIYAVNFEFTGLNPTEGGITVAVLKFGVLIPARPPPPDTLILNLSDDFYANPGERVALAIQPASRPKHRRTWSRPGFAA